MFPTNHINSDYRVFKNCFPFYLFCVCLCTCMRVYSCKDVPMEFKQQLSGISFFCDRETSRQNSGKHLDQLSHLGSP